MKCHKPDSDENAFLQVFVGDYALPEYIHPSAAASDPNTLECFIPVSEGEMITVKGEFKGTAAHGCIDLLADGSYLADKRIELGDLKFYSRKIDFTEFYDVPLFDGTDEPYEKKDVKKGFLKITHLEEPKKLEKHLQEHAQSEGSGIPEFGVGALTVIISISQTPGDTHKLDPPYPDMTCGNWRERGDYEGSEGLIRPTHELIHVQKAKSEVHYNAQSMHRRHWKQHRSGPKPWAKFIFYYRDHMSIEQAGCVRRDDKSHPLEPKNITQNTAEDEEDDKPLSALQKKKKKEKKKLFGQELFPNRVTISEPNNRESSLASADDTPTLAIDNVGEGEESSFSNNQSSASLKRPLESPGESREQPPSKMPRTSDKKAALLAAHEEKLRRNQAAEKALEENQKLRDNEQAKLEALEADDINELERKIDALDEDYAVKRKATEDLQEEIREIREKCMQLKK